MRSVRRSSVIAISIVAALLVLGGTEGRIAVERLRDDEAARGWTVAAEPGAAEQLRWELLLGSFATIAVLAVLAKHSRRGLLGGGATLAAAGQDARRPDLAPRHAQLH